MYNNDVNDKSIKVKGGRQIITTNDGYIHPLDIKDGLPYIKIRPFTDDEWDNLPHVVWTSDVDWDPSILDYSFKETDAWYDAQSDVNPIFDERGNYRRCVDAQETECEYFFDTFEDYSPLLEIDCDVSPVDYSVYFHTSHALNINERTVDCQPPLYEQQRP